MDCVVEKAGLQRQEGEGRKERRKKRREKKRTERQSRGRRR
jgi:hypothetical protein